MSAADLSRLRVVFASPRRLPKARELDGRVVVLDIAFASEGLGKGFRKTTGKFITQLGDRLARWVDHHDHPAHPEFADDPRFVLATKAEHGACPEMIDEELVRDTGPVDTVVAHFDLDGLYAAVKWILGGREPYPGADDDARAVDTRIGPVGPEATAIDKALRAHYRDEVLKQRIIRYLVEGLKPGPEREAIAKAAADYDRMAARSVAIADSYAVEGELAVVSVPGGAGDFDKTELLLLGQKLATVAVVVDGGNVSIAAPFDSGLNFVDLLDLGGGMPTRVNVPRKRLDDSLAKIRAALDARSSSASESVEPSE
ncbi:hypothetical protein PPSIR1_09241 [Plesiocystis pacifica SIR-1]|uniref:Uncharacterized protein n=1 Tax=Plesiocystis pacifica SIR-1 TaxID=391625 RepID=A6G777_9BACT|nr:hypothetical protein [Plesiocystis pacifica]EDM78353.1 hypothetical protein PPSIR1_09241 [Plesiocystis pacifica SIR-1]